MRIFSRALDAAEIDQRAPRTASKGNGMFQHRMCSGGCAVILVALIAAGCCSDPWRVYPEHTAPDRTCSTGSVAGYDVYIWDCLRGQHVVVAQWSGEMSCRSPVQEIRVRHAHAAREHAGAYAGDVCGAALRPCLGSLNTTC